MTRLGDRKILATNLLTRVTFYAIWKILIFNVKLLWPLCGKKLATFLVQHLVTLLESILSKWSLVVNFYYYFKIFRKTAFSSRKNVELKVNDNYRMTPTN